MPARYGKTAMQVELCEDHDGAAWDAYVADCRHASHYHRYGWKRVIESVYRHACPYVVARKAGDIVGVLPLSIIKSRLFGRSLTSLPFVDTAGVAAKDTEVSDQLVDRALRLAESERLSYVELRQHQPLAGNFRVDTYKCSFVLPLLGTEDMQWNNISGERRNRVRKATQNDLTVEQADATMLNEFYGAWSENMRDLGSPAHPVRWFQAVLAAFPDSARLLVVRKAASVVGGALLLRHGDTLSAPWISSRRSSFPFHPNDLLYWECIKLAVKTNCAAFDFGRSTVGSGNAVYKMRWGAKEVPLYWHYHALKGGEARLPDKDDGALEWATRAWKKLPVPVANLVGPLIRRSITK